MWQAGNKFVATISLLGATGVLFPGLSARADEPAAKVPSAAAVEAALTSGVPMSSNTIADIAQAVAPAVVNIDVKQEVTRSSRSMPDFESMFGGLPFKFFFDGSQMVPNNKNGAPDNLPKRERQDTGSGFVIRPDGYILTNAHVVRNATKIKVTFNDKRVLDGKVVGIDRFSDIAVVKVDAHDLPIANMGSSKDTRAGEFVIAIGSPQMLDHTVTFGIISAVGRTIADVNGNISFMQTDAAINPGNSGGPLLNLYGKVIGVNTAVQTNAQNIGFSIPIDIAKSVAESLIDHKTISRPWLGIVMSGLDENMAKGIGLPGDTKGVYIVQTLAGSPADKAGLLKGDIIQKIDGKEVTESKEVQDLVKSRNVSEVLHFLVLRNKAAKGVAVNIGQYPNTAMNDEDDD